jgi:hypothetical protein
VLTQPSPVAFLVGSRIGKGAINLKNPILLHDHPTLIAASVERSTESLKVDIAVSKRAENPSPPSSEHVSAVVMNSLKHVHAHVLQVDRAYALAPVPQRDDGITPSQR